MHRDANGAPCRELFLSSELLNSVFTNFGRDLSSAVGAYRPGSCEMLFHFFREMQGKLFFCKKDFIHKKYFCSKVESSNATELLEISDCNILLQILVAHTELNYQAMVKLRNLKTARSRVATRPGLPGTSRNRA